MKYTLDMIVQDGKECYFLLIRPFNQFISQSILDFLREHSLTKGSYGVLYSPSEIYWWSFSDINILDSVTTHLEEFFGFSWSDS